MVQESGLHIIKFLVYHEAKWDYNNSNNMYTQQ